MKKTLVEAANLDAFICTEHNTLYADGALLLTPGARDALSKRGVTIVYGPNPHAGQGQHVECHANCHDDHRHDAHPAPATSEGEARLVLAVAAMLQEHCGIKDPATLHALSSCIVRTIGENI